MRPTLSFRKHVSLFFHELTEIIRLFLRLPKNKRMIIFYVAQAQYISYFEGLINKLLELDTAVCYISSDFDDPVFEKDAAGFHTFYINKLYPFVAPFLDAKVIVYTMPDLNLFHIRRSIFDAEHIFVFHSLCSSHMGLNLGSLDHFDTIFCNGPYHKNEIQKMESIYNLTPKNLIEAGYYRLEKIYRQQQNQQATSRKSLKEKPLVLIAPSWQKNNIIEACGHKLLEVLLKHDFNVVLRPHPMTIYKKSQLLTAIQEKFGDRENFHLDTETVSEIYLHEADVMICDWSGVAMEYAFGVEKPVLFIDLPPKIHNSAYQLICMEPLESAIRYQIGKVISPDKIEQAGMIVEEFLTQSEMYRARIVRARQEHIYHFGRSPEIGAKYILSII
jgi:CDP-Glycerol:Poly(glycerophosphate) glycerophosphotransferase